MVLRLFGVGTSYLSDCVQHARHNGGYLEWGTRTIGGGIPPGKHTSTLGLGPGQLCWHN